MNLRAAALAAVPFVGVLFMAVPGFATPEATVKRPPPPSEGTISPSGKFTPAHLPGTTNAIPPQTPAEAEAALKASLKVEQTGPNIFRIGRVEFDRQQRTVSVPARVTIRTQVIEYALVTEQGKAYESLFTTEASPTDVHLAFLLLGVSPVAVSGDMRKPAPLPSTNVVRIEMYWPTNGPSRPVALSDLIQLAKSPTEPAPRALGVEQWLYNGSLIDQWGFAAQREGSLVALIRDPSALVNNPSADRDNDSLHWPNQKLLPPEGTRVRLTFRLPAPPAAPSRPTPPWMTPITPLSTNQ